jgi:predicted lipoprotein
MNRILAILCYAAFAGGLLWFFPLFHVVRNNVFDSTKQSSPSNAAEIAERFWSEQLIPSLKKAPEATSVLSALRDDPQSALARFGRKVGVSHTCLLVLQGGGTIVTADKKGVGVSFRPDAREPDIILKTGLLFGNVLRDATGLLEVSNFADSRQFNEVSTELNRIAEARVIVRLKDKAVVGRHISFAGCAEIPDDAKEIIPLTIIPFAAHIE